MKTANVVIGANFGDEGKGLLTDYFAAQGGGNAVVIRHNGGAQAGHTVVTPDSRRHVFSHFGSGVFTGAESFLSRFFVCNPLLFLKEREILKAKTEIPRIAVDPRAPVTTPFDMMLNQIAEEARGAARHGSCGMGFGETLARHETEGCGLTYADLSDKAALKVKLRHFRDTWVPARLKALGIGAVEEPWLSRLKGDGILDKYIEDVQAFLTATRSGSAAEAADGKAVVFEGAQGLLLDQDHGWFPHVTRSHTGLRNVLSIAAEAGIDSLDVTYVTRAYGTRHGAGPLPQELGRLPYPRIVDATNVTNAYQGSLRFGWLDADLLKASLQRDLGENRAAVKLRFGLAVTCLDQLDDKATCLLDASLTETVTAELPTRLQKATGAEYLLTSHGPSRRDISAPV
jgi:adenylosuccinate synthase